MKLAIDSDKNGMELKKTLLEHLKAKQADITDLDYLNTHEAGDYPDIAYNLALKIKNGEYWRGILICGTGLGMAICANKVQGVYAGACTDAYEAERLVKSNNAQIITLGALVTGVESAKTIINAWLASVFEGGRSLPKVARIREIEKEIFEQKQSLYGDNEGRDCL